jgi:glutamyl/glutaminyl-tRNA synthetase
MPPTTPQFIKTRIAPTPSGYLHLGNVLSFAITAALAKKHGAKILLRIDDLDRDRANPLYVQDIFDTLNFLEIPYHDGPRNFEEYEQSWSQVHRMDRYQQALQQLQDNDAVFACTCSRAQIRSMSNEIYPGSCLNKSIPLDAGNVSWRLKMNSIIPIGIKDISSDITTATLPATMQSFVVRKKDGYPAYQLTSVLDDMHYGVDMIIRGADLWDSTLAQQYLATLIGAKAFRDITFYHHPLLMADGKEKLSKSAGATSIHYLRGEGKTPADIFTAVAGMLGFSARVNDWEELAELMEL